ncbi:MAG TPA: preprotein translocase subunit SecY [Gemmatimonadaceae bacterium]|uniref:Protein translocase subunit SecY n=1 Tax=uncultured Gemmatimonadetes bacterium Rifle_16ft_4_minimus_37772 TaxID=1665097 RepID=A0A0H4T4Z4_9BACT|nr:preprotein translocase subunit, preprotein translocase subunit SecY [uncultured Gemmatimonadetes bacterium Rifle_16ft_4_minimus_37772]HLA90114.1 preprotein translocase subunit SecY [Gemmatimonadaceae bacterium]
MAQANPAQALANIYRTPELWQKITFTAVCLLIYRVGSHVAAPGVDVQAMVDYFANLSKTPGGGFFGLYDLFVGGNLSRSTIFALGIMPYISSSIFAQIFAAVIPAADKMQKDEEGRKKITQWTRYGTVALAMVQAWGFALFTESVQGAVGTPGFAFRIEMSFILTTGAIFVMWLGEQITERGLGNGASLMIFFSIIERFWPGIIDTFRFVSTGAINLVVLTMLGLMMLGVVAGVVAITIAARRIAIQIPQRTMARGRMREAAKNFIPLRINSAGVMPIIFAQSLIVVPGALAQFGGNQKLAEFADFFQPGTWLYFALSAGLIVFFTYFYTSIIFNPIDLAENLKKQGGFIPGIKPGARTAEYIDHVVSRITFPGAVFLTIIALLPIWIADMANVPFRFGGTSLLIVVGVALDTLAQMQQHLLLRKYDGFMKKGRVRFRGRTAGSF